VRHSPDPVFDVKSVFSYIFLRDAYTEHTTFNCSGGFGKDVKELLVSDKKRQTW